MSESKKYSFEVARSNIGDKLILAVWSDSGFAHYEVFRATEYHQRKIRKILYGWEARGVKVPHKIDWEAIPKKDFVKPFGADANV